MVSLTPLAPDGLEAMVRNLSAAFPNQDVLVATPDPAPAATTTLRVLSYTPQAPAPGSWVLTAADYLNAYTLMEEHGASYCMLLGAEAQSLQPEALRALAEPVMAGTAGLTMSRYSLGPRDGLVNSAILYPTTRALFGTRPHYPLAIDLAFSAKLGERLAMCAQKFTAAGQNNALVWTVAEAAADGIPIAEAPVGARALPPPETTDLNTLLAVVAGSFFADIDAKASFWQRARLAYPPHSGPPPIKRENGATSAGPEAGETPDIQPMLETFHLAYTNLLEIWSLVLPPNSLLGLKKLSQLPANAFRMPDSLWARIVYDFVLAYRLRTLNRGHLLGALTPLYLAWVASHLLLASGAGPEHMAPEVHVETLAAAFEADKPYLVSRWRWPDRFNP